jgi:hypothetical protein
LIVACDAQIEAMFQAFNSKADVKAAPLSG